MRVRINKADIYEIFKVIVTPCGHADENNPEKYRDMHCFLELRFGDDEYDCFKGEFDCQGADNFEDCEKASYKFLDELYKNGCIDISTDEKCAKYGLTIY